jgi:hypothetical protein
MSKICAIIHPFIVSTNYIDFMTHNLIVRNIQVKSRGTTLGTRRLNGFI